MWVVYLIVLHRFSGTDKVIVGQEAEDCLEEEVLSVRLDEGRREILLADFIIVLLKVECLSDYNQITLIALESFEYSRVRTRRSLALTRSWLACVGVSSAWYSSAAFS